MGTWGISRTASTSIIVLGFVLILLGIFSLVAPLISAEFLKLAKSLPDYADQFWDMTQDYRMHLKDRVGDDEMTQLRAALDNSAGNLLNMTQSFLAGIINGGQAIISFFSIIVIMPVVAFYMMIEWPRMNSWIASYIPEHHSDTVHNLLKNIDCKLSGFIRGQLMVALILAILYAAAMKIAGLNFGLAIGLTAGLLSIIPLVGSAIGLLVGAFVAYFQNFDLSFVALIAAIFFAGQILEGYVLTPKLVGDRVGLHPLWILFALMGGGALFGFIGVLIAVPVTAIISVFVSFALDQYKKSDFFKNPHSDPLHSDSDNEAEHSKS